MPIDPDSVNVTYKALADFSALHKSALQAKKDIQDLRAAQSKANAADLAEQKKLQNAYDKTGQSSKNKVKFVDAEAKSTKNAASEADNAVKSLENEARASKNAASSADTHTNSEKKRASTLKNIIGILRDSGSAVDGLNKKYTNSTPIMKRVQAAWSSLHKAEQDVNTETDKASNLVTRAKSAWLSYQNTLKSGSNQMKKTGKDADSLGKKIHNALSQKSSVGGLPWGLLIGLIGALLSVINPAIAGIGALGTAALALGGNIASLSGNLLVIPSGLLAIVSAVAGVKVALNGVSTAFKDSSGDADTYAKDLKNLSPSAASFVKQIVALKKPWTDIQKNTQESFFGPFVKDLGTLNKLLPIARTYLQSGASAAGNFIDKFLKLASSGPWTSDFNKMVGGNTDILNSMGDALLSILTAFKDIAVVAQPFAVLLSGKIAAGAKSFANMISVSRNNGSLTAWIDQSNTRLLIWWGIIKNIGSTLFNYGKATSQLGDWLSQGFLNITAGWKKASEDATKAGSPFQKYLQNIKPVLSEVKGLLGDFFSWLGKEGEDPGNLKTMTSLLHTVRTDLGPALGKILDAFAKSGIGESIIKSLSSIADAIGDILKKGGGDGLKSFFGTLQEIFDIIDKVVSIPGVGSTLGQIAAALGVIAALKFVGKYTGLISLFKMFTGGGGLGTAAKDATTLEGAFAGMNGMKFAGLLKLLPALTVLATLSDAAGAGKNNKVGTAAKGKKNVDAANNIVTGSIGNDETFNSKSQAEKFLKSPEGKGYGDSTTAGVEGTNAFVQGKDGKLYLVYRDKTGNGFGIKPTTGNGVKDVAAAKNPGKKSAPAGGALGGGGAFTGPVTGPPKQQVATQQSSYAQSTKDVKNNVAALAELKKTNDQVTLSVFAANAAIAKNGKNFDQSTTAGKNNKQALDQVAKAEEANIQATEKNTGSQKDTTAAWEAGRTKLYQVASQMGLTGKAADDYVNNHLKKIPPQINTTITNNAPSIKQNVDNLNAALASLPKAEYVDIYQTTHILQQVSATREQEQHTGYSGGEVANGVNRAFRNFWKGGASYLAKGGKPRQVGTDTVPAMLTPGEYVLNKNIVSQIGVGKLNKLNKGNMSYSDMLATQAGSMSMAQRQKSKLFQPSFATNMPTAFSTPVIPQSKVPATKSSSDSPLIAGDLVIHNPVAEKASDSLPRAIRKAAYVTNRKHS